MRSVTAGAAVCAVLLCAPGVRAQQAGCKGMAGMDGVAEATPPEKLPPPIALTGTGNSAIAITTSSADAGLPQMVAARAWFGGPALAANEAGR